MSELRWETWTMPAGAIGPENPHPPFVARGVNQPSPERVDPSIPPKVAATLGYGGRANPLPYRMQDDLSRERRPRAFETAVLENDLLRAVFLLELGGRLWSLTHKPSGRELLYVNPVFQPCNLALRAAWFSGGVEWNFCWPGHTPLTCSPLFVAECRLEDGTPVLRLYEFERGRAMPYQMDFFLPDGSPVLFLRVRLRNPHRSTVPIYWWSNIAVPEAPDVRILVPADQVYRFAYQTLRLELVPHPYLDGRDRSRPTQIPHACDSFYRVPDELQWPWIASVDESGRGLFQISTAALRGRKLFVWGQSPLGLKWQRFLNPATGAPYVEIQAGLEPTQASCQPLKAGDSVEWLEAYGLLETDPVIAHGKDWQTARRHAEDRIQRVIHPNVLDRLLASTADMADCTPQVVRLADGWGALENLRRAADGEPMLPSSMPFPETSLGAPQAPWLMLLRENRLPEPDPLEPPLSYMSQPEWVARLERSLGTSQGDHWAAWLQLGVAHLAEERWEEARQAWLRSFERSANPWAARNLARGYLEKQEWPAALTWFTRAYAMAPRDLRLMLEFAECLIRGGRAAEALDLLHTAPDHAKRRGRYRLLEIWAASEAEQDERFMRLIQDPFEIEDAREGETSMRRIWVEYHARRMARARGEPVSDSWRQMAAQTYPPPTWLDYSM